MDGPLRECPCLGINHALFHVIKCVQNGVRQNDETNDIYLKYIFLKDYCCTIARWLIVVCSTLTLSTHYDHVIILIMILLSLITFQTLFF